MSKKLAEGIDALVLDVKAGSGAFMKTRERARELARRMVEIGTAHGKPVRALLTAMDQPLGRAVGNALEVIEILEALKGRGPADLMDVSRELTARMFVLGGIDSGLDAARVRFDRLLASGAALGKLAEIIAAQGGDRGVIDDYTRLPHAGHEESVVAWEDGHVAALEAEAIGRAAMRLGAGRERLDSVIDPAVGLVFEKKVGDPVEAGERICAIYANGSGAESRLATARAALRAALGISPEPVPPPSPILEDIS
jgi:thymidine phosphorylase